MNFDDYNVLGFDKLDDCGKTYEEKVSIINGVFEVFGLDRSVEKEKFTKMQNDGNDMKTVAGIFGGVLMEMFNELGIEDFNDLKDLPHCLATMKRGSNE